MNQQETPFKIKITQCSVGRYNLLSSEESLSFHMGIYTEDNKVYEENGIKAILHYSGEPDELYIFENALENLGEVFEKCFDYSNKIISSTDYQAQCLLFAKTYCKYFDVLEINTRVKRDSEILAEIERLQKKLKYPALDNIDYEIERTINTQIKNNKSRIDYYLGKNLELKEDSETYTKNLGFITKYEVKNNILNNVLTYINKT